jgi:DNA polymerase III subunit gamma/tau
VDILIAEEDSFRHSQEIRIKLETIIVRMAYLDPVIPIGDIISTIEAIEQKLQQSFVTGKISGQETKGKLLTGESSVGFAPDRENGAAATVTGPENRVANTKETVSLTELNDNFKKFIKKENPILGAKTVAAEIISFTGGNLSLSFPKGFIFLEDLNEKSQKEQLENIAKKFFHEDVIIKISTTEVDKAVSHAGNGRSKANNINDIKREALNNPILQKIMDEFAGAEIVEIKTRTEKSS